MNVCPICLYVNNAAASTCTRCGKFHFGSEPAVAVADPPLSPSSGSSTRTTPDAPASAITKLSGVVSVLQNLRSTSDSSDTQGRVAFTLLPKKDGGQTSSSGVSSRMVFRPRLEVVRGEKLGVTFPVLEGKNILGRTVVTPVDLDLTGQEPSERVWTSRQHACVLFDGKSVILEDMNSLNGTFVNRQRLFPGQQRVLHPNDVVQVGTVQLRLLVSADQTEV